MAKPLLGILLAVTIILTSVTLIEYQRIVELEGHAPSTTTVSVVTTQNVTTQFLVEVTTTLGASQSQARTTTITVTAEANPTTSTQTCTVGTLGSCNFHEDGYLDIQGLPQFYYLDVSALNLPTTFTFEGVTFNGTVRYNACDSPGGCTGPAITCVDYSAIVLKNDTSYNMSQCTDAYDVPFYSSIFLYPESAPQVGFMWLQDGTVYVLVVDQ